MAEERQRKKQKILIPTTTTTRSATPTTVATRIILNDANNGFKDGNFVCSPLSIEAVLGMLAAGAKGKTFKQLLDFLGHKTMDQLLYESPSSKLYQQILSKDPNNNAEGDLDIALANGIWVDKTMNPVQSGYEKVLKTVYKTKAIFVDFENKRDNSASEINSWVNKETRGLIPTIVQSNELKQAKIVLANVLYFKGLWSERFDAKRTKDKDFHLISGETISVPFMTTKTKIRYGSTKKYKMIKLPYKCIGISNELSMYIFLPNKKDGLQNLVEVFNSDHELFHKKYNLYKQRLDEFWIPKFKISCKFEPRDVMEQMGLTLPFEPLNMDFTRIVDSTHPDADKLYVSNILQQSFIEVDEKGTEAAAASLLKLRTGCAILYKPPPPAPTFVANHPFMFMIREDISQAVLFLGVVLNPK